MSLATRCPVCEALFRVAPEQLRMRAGQVRCGRCNAVFDGLAHLVPETARPAARTEEPKAESAAGQPTGIESLDFVVDAKPRQAPATAVLSPEPVEAGFLDNKRERLHGLWRREWPSVLASVLLAFLLLVQIAWRQPDVLAAEHPVLRPVLAMFCSALGCELGLPRTQEHLAIEDDEMIAADPGTPGRVTLLATLRNNAPFAVAYPSLELSLQNGRNEVLARRVLAPSEYLERGTQLADGLAARSDVNLRLALDTGGLAAEGYRLLVFYPANP